MSTHPYIPLYVDDFDAATTHLTAEEDGFYNRLLRLAWRTPGCSLPIDDVWIARKIRATAEEFERVARGVLAEFFTVYRGRYVQRRLKREYDSISCKRLARVNAGKKGGSAKALKTNTIAPSNATVLPQHTRAYHTHTHTQKEEELTLSLNGSAVGDRDSEFEAFWRHYPRKVGKVAARKAYDRARKSGVGAEALVEAVDRTRWPADVQFIPHPTTWLNDGRWMDAEAKPQRPKQAEWC